MGLRIPVDRVFRVEGSLYPLWYPVWSLLYLFLFLSFFFFFWIFVRDTRTIYLLFYQICKCYLAHKQVTQENHIYWLVPVVIEIWFCVQTQWRFFIKLSKDSCIFLFLYTYCIFLKKILQYIYITDSLPKLMTALSS